MTKVQRLLLMLFLFGTPLFGQQIYTFYSPGDWVSYTNTRYVTAIARGFNTIYFGTTEGIIRYDFLDRKWLAPLTVSDGLPDNRISRLAVDRLTDEIWVDTPVGGSYFNPTWAQWQNTQDFPAGKVQSPGVRISDLPLLFPSTGYSYLPGGTLADRYMTDYSITQMLRDDNDVVWMGIWGLGAGKADLRRDDLEVMPFGLFDTDVSFLDRDGQDFWFLGGTNGLPGSITHYDRTGDKWEYFESDRESGIISDRFLSLAHDDKRVWIGTDLGLIKFDKVNRSFKSYSHFDGIDGDNVIALLPVSNNLLIGTEQGISVFDLVRDSIYSANSSNMRGQPIYDFAIRNRTIYAATQSGVYTLEWGAGQWNRLVLPFPDLKGAVYDMQIVDSVLYTAGDDGIAVIDLNDNTMKLFDRATQFHNSDLTHLLVHQGVIWVAGNDGLYRFNRNTGNWYQYTTSDGLVSDHVTGLVGDGKYVWIGTDQGVSRFLWKSFGRSDWLE